MSTFRTQSIPQPHSLTHNGQNWQKCPKLSESYPYRSKLAKTFLDTFSRFDRFGLDFVDCSQIGLIESTKKQTYTCHIMLKLCSLDLAFSNWIAFFYENTLITFMYELPYYIKLNKSWRHSCVLNANGLSIFAFFIKTQS